MPWVSEKYFLEFNSVFKLSKDLLLRRLHQRAVSVGCFCSTRAFPLMIMNF